MPDLLKKRAKKSGLLPGTLVYIGNKVKEKVRIHVIDYSEKAVREKEIKDFKECSPFKKTPTTTWINVDGIHRIGIMTELGESFELHPLVMEDILNTDQRPKLEDFDKYIYIVLKSIDYDNKKNRITTGQISIIFGSNFVISFQEEPGDNFDQIRNRIRNNKGKIRKLGPDYLAYSLMDAIIDNYFVVLEKVGERIEKLEDELVTNPNHDTMQRLHNLKREMLFLRKAVWPLREVINTFERGDSHLVQETTKVYLRDVYDHTIEVMDTIETFRDMLSGMIDVYLSSLSYKMNEVMKVLTIIATIFIPLTFIVGLYGMNFKYMPELESTWGYPGVLIAMAVIVVFMLYFFRKKKWI